LIGTCRHLVGIAVTTATGRKEPRYTLGRGQAQNAPSAHSFGEPDLYHMANLAEVATPVAEDRSLHAVLNGKKRDRFSADSPTQQDKPDADRP